MAKTYDEYEVDQMAKAQKQKEDYAAQRKAQADEAVKTSDSLHDTAISNAEKDADAAVKSTESGYRDVFDANAVNELVARRNVEEAMANMGLTDSGLNATHQTAISLQRGRADSKATQQKQAAVDAIIRELEKMRETYNAEKTAAAANIYAQADADILNFKSSADAAARQNAASLYAADQEAEAARYAAEQEAETARIKAQQEAAIKQAQMLLDAEKIASQERLKMTELGYRYDEEAGGYVRTDESNTSMLKQTAESMLEKGISADAVSQYLRTQGQFLNVPAQSLASILYELGLYDIGADENGDLITTTTETVPVTKTEDTKKKKKENQTVVHTSSSGTTHGGLGGGF